MSPDSRNTWRWTAHVRIFVSARSAEEQAPDVVRFIGELADNTHGVRLASGQGMATSFDVDGDTRLHACSQAVGFVLSVAERAGIAADHLSITVEHVNLADPPQ